jgi:hypothetical protein
MTRIYRQSLLLFGLICIFNPAFSIGNVPVPIDSVDFGRIPHKKVRNLIHQQKQYGVCTFNDIYPVCYNSPDSNQYRIYTKSQLIKKDINVVWNNLTHLSPKDEFDGRIVKFGLLYSKRNNNLLYRNEFNPGAEEGQILFFNLRMLSGIKNLAVALEVTRMDNDRKTIEYCYIDHGKTKGTQQITLHSTPEGYTEITQLTRYKCKSPLRNHGLYAYFHNRIVKELFNNIKVKSELGTSTLVSK